VAVVVGGIGVVADKVIAGKHLARDVRMGGQNPGIEHRDHDLRGSRGRIPGGRGLDLREIPLRTLGEVGIVCRANGAGLEIRLGIFHVLVALQSQQHLFRGVCRDRDDADVKGGDRSMLAGTVRGEQRVQRRFGHVNLGFYQEMNHSICRRSRVQGGD